ncbi:DUF6549 family protein [Flammeovirga aprica]|uniref:Uncharacterized protein n=1 Tax=Flammeovirga aprica JL-4 TaxID=694437 RepID=A0A7X9RUL5_9BACT|nr:DUF6549 family protein [Flammeovirga aprica]NME69001.1 hypothetical protein [Flammeovirga aprica JL-4]
MITTLFAGMTFPYAKHLFLKFYKQVVILILAVITGSLTFTTCSKNKEIGELKDLSESYTQDIESYKNKYNQEVAKADGLALSKSTLKEVYEQEKFEWLSKYKGLQKKYRNLESAYQVSLNASAKVDNIIVVDTTVNIIIDEVEREEFAKAFYWYDDYAFIDAYVTESNFASLEYEVKVPIEVVAYWERNWFLGKKHWKVEVLSPNPSIKVNGVNSIIIKKK